MKSRGADGARFESCQVPFLFSFFFFFFFVFGLYIPFFTAIYATKLKQ